MQGRVAKGMPELPGCLRKKLESISTHDIVDKAGYDACLLVEHAGLKTMMDLSFSHNYPKVGFPCENLGQVVAHLTTIGFTMSENLKEMVPRKGMNEASVIYFYRIK
ncbi:unnamed protein product [Lactuca virosa]|uniref:Uncharacterized protein n=1 Tax=Lactuca virosa TaxID=75947 RepID=A0AAU9NTZ7_9ASTR|nr:unnamed protein product [Lactuca virosa]